MLFASLAQLKFVTLTIALSVAAQDVCVCNSLGLFVELVLANRCLPASPYLFASQMNPAFKNPTD